MTDGPRRSPPAVGHLVDPLAHLPTRSMLPASPWQSGESSGRVSVLVEIQRGEGRW